MSSKKKIIIKKESDSPKLDINIKILEQHPKTELTEPSLKLEFSGKDINNVFVNSLRRVGMMNLLTYAFPSELMSITKNTTIYNNDYMRLRLSSLPIYDIDDEDFQKLYYLETKYWHPKTNFADKIREKYSKERNIELYINAKNETSEVLNITTNDILYFEDGKPIEKYNKKFPILIIQLRPTEVFDAVLKSALSCGVYHDIFAASHIFYDNEDDKILMTVESHGQIAPLDILKKACKYILKKLDDFKIHFKESLSASAPYEKNTKLTFEFDNENHTMGEMLNYVFQENENIIFSGVSKPSHLEQKIKIKIISKNEHPLKYMIQSVEYLEQVYNYIYDNLI